MSSLDDVFYYDFAAPAAYPAAERMPRATWMPIRAPAPAPEAFGALVAEQGLQPLRMPDPFPFDSEPALLAATYAATIGKVVAFSLAAFRQAYAAGRALDEDTVVIAAAACEMHPRAVLQALDRDAIRRRLDEACEQAAERSITEVPALWSPARATS